MSGEFKLLALTERLRSCRTMLVERHGATPAPSSEEASTEVGSDSTSMQRSIPPQSYPSSTTQSQSLTRSDSSSVEQMRSNIDVVLPTPLGRVSSIAGRAGMRRGVQTGRQLWDESCRDALKQGTHLINRRERGEEAAGELCDSSTLWFKREQHRERMGMIAQGEENAFVTLLRNAPPESPDRLLLEVVDEIEASISTLALPLPPGASPGDGPSNRHVQRIPIYDKLMDFQKEGVEWLYELWREGWNTILADEMGLGKTIQSIALLQAVRLTPKHAAATSIIVAPLSTLTNWESEFAAFDPSQRVASLVGDITARNAVAKKVLRGEVDVLLMQFDSLAKKLPRGSTVAKLKTHTWGMLVVDEAHRIKNSQSTLYTALEGMTFQSKLVLTGTPLQNSVRELLSLIRFMVPLTRGRKTTKRFTSLADQVDVVLRQTAIAAPGDTEEEGQLFQNEQLRIYVCRRLHRLVEPFLLRRERDDVLTNMPAKDEHVLVCPASAHQLGLLAVLEERKRSGCFTGCTAIDFRKVLLHPYLVDRTSYYISQEVIYASGKFFALDLLTRFLWSTGRHKFLIFCSWTKVLDIVESMNIERDMPYVRLCGAVTGENRAARIHQFNTSPASQLPCFLISKIAGGVGLNLQAADTVIMLDEDYNPQRDLQALSRVYRVGQSKHVKVFRLAIAHSQEERISAIAKDKEQLAQAVMSAGMFNLKATDEDREEAVASIITKTPTPAAGPTAGSPTVGALPQTAAANIEGCNQFRPGDVEALGLQLRKCVPRGADEAKQLDEFLQVERKRKRE